MKISAKQYAQCLYDLTADQDEASAKKAIAGLAVLLKKNRDLDRLPEISAAFTDLWNQEHGLLPAELATARPLAPEAKNIILDYLKNKTKAKEILLTESIDPQLLGGFVLKYGSRIIDGSLRSSLSDLSHNLKA